MARTDDPITPEEVYRDRRRFLKRLGLGAAGLAGLGLVGAGWLAERGPTREPGPPVPPDVLSRYPAPRSGHVVDRPLTPRRVATTYNNFFELSGDKDEVHRVARGLVTRPWTLEVGGLVARPARFDVDDLVRRFPLEERVYRHRCVEAWSMTVPWTGFPLHRLLDRVEPLSRARWVRFVSFDQRAGAPGMAREPHYPWPYVEALRIDEASHDLTLLVTGIYGQPLPAQSGAPLRLVVPWKYGFKSAKSLTRIELVDRRPATFWNRVAPREYGLIANVDPATPHPRWSQELERDIATGARRPTLPFNGYGDEVAGLYPRG